MINLDSNIYFHIGYHRTGSTFLQKFIFPQYKDYSELFLPFNNTDYLAGFFYKKNTNLTENQIEVRLKQHLEGSRKPIIASSEGISGSLFYANEGVAERIYKTFPHSKIIICIRSQYTMIPSLYQYMFVKSGGNLLYQDFLKKIIDTDKLNYYKLISSFMDKFGGPAVKVMFYEDLKNNQIEFLDSLLEFIDLPKIYKLNGGKRFINKRYGLLLTSFLRFKNELLYNSQTARPFYMLKTDYTDVIYNFFKKLVWKLDIMNNRLNLFHFRSYEEDKRCREIIYRNYKTQNSELKRIINMGSVEKYYPM